MPDKPMLDAEGASRVWPESEPRAQHVALAPRVDPDLVAAMRADPATRMQAIVFAQDGLDDLLSTLPPDVRVEHTYSLIGSVCVSASVADLRRLMDMPAVKSIESIRTVSHW